MRCLSWRSSCRLELVGELRLADQHDLDQLVGRGLEVGEHAEVLERLDRHVLRFVHDEDDVAALLVLLDEHLVQAIHHLVDVVGPVPMLELPVDGVEQGLERHDSG